MVVCDEDSLNASMLIGYCMTFDEVTSTAVFGPVHCVLGAG